MSKEQLETLRDQHPEVEFGFTHMKLSWEPGKQPERTPDVGEISVGTDRLSRDKISIRSTESGISTMVTMSPYNAFRVWVALGMLLGLPIPKGTGIKL